MKKEIEIPEGYETRIEDNKAIIEQKENEKIRKVLWEYFHDWQLYSDCDFSPSFTIDDILAYLERRKEQKPAEWNEGETKVLDSIIDDYEKAAKSFCGYAGKIMLLKAIRDGEYDLPKQEWSEEDDAAHTRILGAVAKAFMGVLPTKPSEEDVNWLKTLPERFNLEPKQKWSEEDKRHPQPHWKPSEEQMVALDAAISYLEESDNEDCEILNSLYEDIKKL